MGTLKYKLIIIGQIEVKTGLHIGGSVSNMEIGALDQNNVIKTANGIPYIPGSSLKGKLRNMLAKAVGSKEVGDKEEKRIGSDALFGISGDEKNKNGKEEEKRTEALLRVRDAYLSEKSLTDLPKLETDFEYSEVKYENTINRVTGVANPRPLERVPAGAIFCFEMIYDCFDESEEPNHLQALAFAMKMLQYDSLGGSGTRGSGKIEFKNINISKAVINTNDMIVNPEQDCNYNQFSDFKKDESYEDCNY
ncbi:MAG: type III-A CRISPR-associated RAMP protein Csm3 [Peptostreptococcaceae bacterium]|nr:type III-A CRISPR-associated RAMP protein Csm3 [Peptostreptococcaceae bacterium]